MFQPTRWRGRSPMPRHSRLWQPTGLGWLLRLLGKNGGTIGKVFGTLTYDREMSKAFMPENQPSLQQSVEATEAGL